MDDRKGKPYTKQQQETLSLETSEGVTCASGNHLNPASVK